MSNLRGSSIDVPAVSSRIRKYDELLPGISYPEETNETLRDRFPQSTPFHDAT